MSNAVGGKQDVHLGHRFEVAVELTEPRLVDDEVRSWRTSTARTQIVNPLPSEGRDLYAIGNCLVGGERNQCFEGPPGWDRTWVSMWTPGDDALLGTRGPEGPTEIFAGYMDGLRVFDHFLEVPPEDETWVQVEVEGPMELDWDGRDDVTYTWTWWRQAKATPDLLDVTFDLPEGWRVVTADLQGVGDGRHLLGVDAGSPPAEVDVTGTVADGAGAQHVQLRGAVTRDTTLVLRLSRGGGVASSVVTPSDMGHDRRARATGSSSAAPGSPPAGSWPRRSSGSSRSGRTSPGPSSTASPVAARATTTPTTTPRKRGRSGGRGRADACGCRPAAGGARTSATVRRAAGRRGCAGGGRGAVHGPARGRTSGRRTRDGD